MSTTMKVGSLLGTFVWKTKTNQAKKRKEKYDAPSRT